MYPQSTTLIFEEKFLPMTHYEPMVPPKLTDIYLKTLSEPLVRPLFDA